LHPTATFAAEDVWPETAAIPASRAIEPIGPLPADLPPTQLSLSENGAEPTPPGEGPQIEVDTESGTQNEIDTVTLGEGGAEPSFWKPEFHAGLTASVVFDDNIFISSTDPVSDTQIVTSARMTLAFGNVQQWASRFIDTTSRALVADQQEGTDNLIAVSYSPTAYYFWNNDGLNSLEHDLAGTARWTLSRLRISFDGRVQTLSDPDEELGTRTDRVLTSAMLSGVYDWSEKTRLQLEGVFSNRNYDVGRDSTQIEANGFVLYDITPKSTLGAGLSFGTLEQDDLETDTFQRLLVRYRYNSYAKFTFNVTGGVEFRQGADEEQLNGTIQGGVGYTPSVGSEFYFSVARRVEPSASEQAATIERTTFALGYNQRIFQRATLSTNLEYAFLDYSSSSNFDGSERQDEILRLSTTLTFEVTQNGFVRLGYVYRQNDSSREDVSFDANQFILSATVLF
jgi:hypothetical protein